MSILSQSKTAEAILDENVGLKETIESMFFDLNSGMGRIGTVTVLLAEKPLVIGFDANPAGKHKLMDGDSGRVIAQLQLVLTCEAAEFITTPETATGGEGQNEQ